MNKILKWGNSQIEIKDNTGADGSGSGDIEHKVETSYHHDLKVAGASVLKVGDVAQVLGIANIATGNVQVTGTTSLSGAVQLGDGLHLLGSTSGNLRLEVAAATADYKLILPGAKDASPSSKILAMHSDEPNNLDTMVWARVLTCWSTTTRIPRFPWTMPAGATGDVHGNSFEAVTIQKTVTTVKSDTDATDATTGCLVLTGGLGVTKDVFVGSILSVQAASAFAAATVASGTLQLTGSMSVSDEAQFAKDPSPGLRDEFSSW